MLERHIYLIVRIKLDELSMGVCKASGCSTAGIVLRSGAIKPVVLQFYKLSMGECSAQVGVLAHFSFAIASEREFPNKVASSCALRGPRSAFSNSTHLETSWV